MHVGRFRVVVPNSARDPSLMEPRLLACFSFLSVHFNLCSCLKSPSVAKITSSPRKQVENEFGVESEKVLSPWQVLSSLRQTGNLWELGISQMWRINMSGNVIPELPQQEKYSAF